MYPRNLKYVVLGHHNSRESMQYWKVTIMTLHVKGLWSLPCYVYIHYVHHGSPNKCRTHWLLHKTFPIWMLFTLMFGSVKRHSLWVHCSRVGSDYKLKVKGCHRHWKEEENKIKMALSSSCSYKYTIMCWSFETMNCWFRQVWRRITLKLGLCSTLHVC